MFRSGDFRLKEIEITSIVVDQNLSYEQADDLVAAKDSFWGNLAGQCQGIRQKRIDQGALNFARQEVEVDVSDENHIQITKIDRNTPAHLMVEEMAVMVNQAVGEFHRENQIPGIYRTQAPYEIHEDADLEGPLTLNTCDH